eukprot:8475815-Pyramimonas_sp.AAC.1
MSEDFFICLRGRRAIGTNQTQEARVYSHEEPISYLPQGVAKLDGVGEHKEPSRLEHARHLAEHVPVDVKGVIVDVKGNRVDVKGNSVDVKSNIIDVKSNSVDVKGNSADVKGNRDTCGR